MDNNQLIKAGLILAGGFLVFSLIKPKEDSEGTKKSMEGNLLPAPTPENAEIVLVAYQDALKNGEPAARLTELNMECMKEFGLRCYIDQKTGQTVVCDSKSEPVLVK
jgi:hypothetical protein